jgi:hypothetical protein
MSADSKNAPPTPDRHRGVGVRIYTYPKIIFIWPTLVFALICGIGMWVLNDDVRDPRTLASEPTADATAGAPVEGQTTAPAPTAPKIRRFSSWPNILGMLFLFVFAINVMIMAIDFPRFTIIAALLLILAVTFFLLWLGVFFDLLTPLRDFAEGVYAVANSGFYLMIALILGVMFLIVIATRGLDYWEIMPNEILHHHGPLSDLERYPTMNLKFDKEIPDVLEYIMGLGAGRIVLHVGNERRAIVLDNVLWIDEKERRLKNLMGRLEVRVTTDQEMT